MNHVTRLNGKAPPFEVAESGGARVQHTYGPLSRGEAANLGARLTELLAQDTPEDLLRRLSEFRQSIEKSLSRSSSAYQILQQLEESGLKDCARCTKELEERLAKNPHFAVLAKLEEAEKLVTELTGG
jgi:hypothetical protein